MTRVDQLRRLESELRSFRTDDPVERANVAATISLIAAPDSWSRNSFSPGHLTASAFVVHVPTRLLLVNHHRRLARWLQLGGHIDRDETPLQAALREAEEESGLSGLTPFQDRIFDVDVHVIPAARGEPEHRHFDLRYIVLSPEAAGQAVDPKESHELAWVPFEEGIRRMDSPEALRSINKLQRMFPRV